MIKFLADRFFRVLETVVFRNFKVLKFRGALPPESSLDAVFSLDGHYATVEKGSRLSHFVESEEPRVIVTFVGIGSRSGFLLNEVLDGERSVMPDSWWRLEDRDLFLFSFACYSAEYVGASGVRRFLRSAICYEGKVWVAARAGEYWHWFVNEVSEIVRRDSLVGSEVFEEVLQLYLDAISGRKSPDGGGRPDYYVRSALIQQFGQVRLLQGTGI